MNELLSAIEIVVISISMLSVIHGALKEKEKNNWIGPIAKNAWNIVMHVLQILFLFHINRKTLGPVQDLISFYSRAPCPFSKQLRS